MSVKIFVGNLSDEVESDDIRVLFEKYGTVEECDVLKNYGFVHMADKSEADEAIANLNGNTIKGLRMRVELSTGKSRGNPRGGDRRGGGRPRPYPPGPPRRLPPPPRDYDPYDPYYRYAYLERDPYYRLPPYDRYLPPRIPDDRYPPLRRERLLPEDRGYLPPDPRDRLLARERLPPYPEDYYDRLRATERAPPLDPYYRERSPVARPPPEYYDRKPAPTRPAAEAGETTLAPRPTTTAYPPANGYDLYRRPTADTAERSAYSTPTAAGQEYKNGPGTRPPAAYGRPAPAQPQALLRPSMGGGYGPPTQQHTQAAQPKRYDAQSALQTKPIFF